MLSTKVSREGLPTQGADSEAQCLPSGYVGTWGGEFRPSSSLGELPKLELPEQECKVAKNKCSGDKLTWVHTLAPSLASIMCLRLNFYLSVSSSGKWNLK